MAYLTQYEEEHYTPGGQFGVLVLRDLPDEDLLDIAYETDKTVGSAWDEVMAILPGWTNPEWLLVHAAQVLWERGRIDDEELSRFFD